jgi:hypothetical protein
LKEESQRKLFNLLEKKGVKNIVGVPDSTIKHFIDEELNKKKILIATREAGPILVLVKINKGKEKSIRVDISPPNIKNRFMKSLRKK